jgi:hypothetical protein
VKIRAAKILPPFFFLGKPLLLALSLEAAMLF